MNKESKLIFDIHDVSKVGVAVLINILLHDNQHCINIKNEIPDVTFL